MNIFINLKYGVSFIFSGKYLTHREQSPKPCATKDDLFYNISSYGNKRLFSHIKTSFETKNSNK